MTDAVGLHTFSLFTLFPPPVWALSVPNTLLLTVGNRQQDTRGTTVTPYTPNALNQYDQVGAAAYIYDADGNLTDDGTATYAYDAENRLTQVVTGATTVQFTYDAFGRRASKSVNGVITKFFYDGDDLIIETGNDPNALIARYLFGPGIDEPLERKGSTTHYYSADGLGSIVHLTTASGAIAESYTYDVFGQPTIRNGSGTIIPTSAVGNRFLFTGREWDQELGVYYYRARYYHPSVGRFNARDPLGQSMGANLYTYVKNNPLRFVDPTGLDVIVLNDSDAADPLGPLGPFGHNGIAIGNDDAGWDYYSQDGPSGGGGHHTHYNTAAELIADQRARYENAYRIYSSQDQDQKMRDAANRELHHPYCANPYSQNRYHCGDLTNDTLEAGGIDHGEEVFGNPPNDAFKKIKDANPPGGKGDRK